MKTTVLLSLFIAVFGRLMADEVKAWSDWLQRKIHMKAVEKLPPEYRERYDEEWESGREEIPGEVFRLIYSLGLLRAAAGIRTAARQSTENAKQFSSLLKRVLDIVLTVLNLLILSPLLLAIAVAVKLDSHGPVLYFSKRVGKKGRVFRLIKFRTMARNAEQDPRITRSGRFLRQYSLDELPQFINVLRGEMSLVGPRPALASEAGEYMPNHERRLDVQPGITGLWQVQAHRDLPNVTSESLDETYVKNSSVWLDFKIMLRTIGVVLRGK